MFIGHQAVAFAAKRMAPTLSLGWLMLATVLLDLLWPIFLLIGWERVRIEPGNTKVTALAFDSYPFSHSLVAAGVWAFAMVLAWSGLGRRHFKSALVLGGIVVSHWFLDVLSHRPDVPVGFGTRLLVGMGLWNSIPGTMLVEGGAFLAALWSYARLTRPLDGAGQYGLWSFVGVLGAMYLGSIFGPPPPNVKTLALVDLGGLLFVFWAAWFDSRRAIKA